jgi:RHH-type proline utilization regulon transcriptional repressor/proline dehydrogenase/delta 1-pyrroline-5-carboxylate dehydrogenase
LRVLFVQEDIAPRLEKMLAGAMEELAVGDPALLETDIGPVIDEAAKQMLEAHAQRRTRDGGLL